MTGNGCSALWMRLDVPFLFPFMENMTAANIFKRAQARAETATQLSRKCTKSKSHFKKLKTKDRAGARREAPALRRIIALIAETQRSSGHGGLQWPLAEARHSATRLHSSEEADGQSAGQ